MEEREGTRREIWLFISDIVSVIKTFKEIKTSIYIRITYIISPIRKLILSLDCASYNNATFIMMIIHDYV